MSRRCVPAVLGAAMALVLAAAACVPSAPGEAGDPGDPEGGKGPDVDLVEFYDQELEWEECRSGFECATYEVPLDYGDPGGARLDIAAMRQPAAGEDPVGSLIVNPGGPGGSGLDYVEYAPRGMSEEVRERFHVVGFDPRGVGESAPVHCLDDEGLDDYLGLELDSDGPGDITPSGLEALEESNEEFIAACEERSGEMLAHIGTADVARDMDILRELAGDERLTYLGKSYGTYIGTHYAEQFPDRVRAMVLDGALDPSLSNLDLSVQQADGFQTALEAFIADCLELDSCPLADSRGGGQPSAADGMARLEDLLAEAEEQPLENRLGDGREVNSARVELGLLTALYSESSWPVVRSALASAFDGDGTELLQLGDQLYDREPGGSYENSAAALTAVNCLDRPSPDGIEAFEEAARAAAEDSPIFGPSLAWGSLICAEWPEGPEAGAGDGGFSAAGAAPILVVGTTRDSATPYEWAEELAAALDPGVLLTYEGDGHTAYGRGDACVDEVVDTYLVAEQPPEDGTVCGE